jgi:hypothetical protein
MIIETPISVGELVDKITILRIKSRKIKNADKLKNVGAELDKLQYVFSGLTKNSIPDIINEFVMLESINKELWDIEDQIRKKEMLEEFDGEFIELARSVYITNDKRSEVKKKINEMTGSELVEEKSYEQY